MRSRDKAKAQRAKAGFLRRDGRPAPVSNKQERAQGPKAEVPGQTEASSSSTRRWKWTCPFGDVVGFTSNAGLAHTQACRHRLKLHRAQILREREDRARYKVRKVGDHFEWECNVCSRILKAPSKTSFSACIGGISELTMLIDRYGTSRRWRAVAVGLIRFRFRAVSVS